MPKHILPILAGFMDVIMQERSWELGTEGIRKWDLIRWNKLGETLVATRAAFESWRTDPNNPKYLYYLPTDNPDTENPKVFGNESPVPEPYFSQGYKIRYWTNGLTATKVGYTGIGFEPNKDELFPIPTSAISANPALTQHPYFN